jgi:hypothetical protein
MSAYKIKIVRSRVSFPMNHPNTYHTYHISYIRIWWYDIQYCMYWQMFHMYMQLLDTNWCLVSDLLTACSMYVCMYVCMYVWSAARLKTTTSASLPPCLPACLLPCLRACGLVRREGKPIRYMTYRHRPTLSPSLPTSLPPSLPSVCMYVVGTIPVRDRRFLALSRRLGVSELRVHVYDRQIGLKATIWVTLDHLNSSSTPCLIQPRYDLSVSVKHCDLIDSPRVDFNNRWAWSLSHFGKIGSHPHAARHREPPRASDSGRDRVGEEASNAPAAVTLIDTHWYTGVHTDTHWYRGIRLIKSNSGAHSEPGWFYGKGSLNSWTRTYLNKHICIIKVSYHRRFKPATYNQLHIISSLELAVDSSYIQRAALWSWKDLEIRKFRKI